MFQRVEHALVVERPGQLQVIGVARHAVEIGQHLGHAALFGVERPLHLFRRQAVHPEPGPVGHVGQHFQRLRVAATLVGIQQTGHDLVQGIPRRPNRLALFKLVNHRLGKRGQITLVKTRRRGMALALRQPGDEIIHPLLEPGVARAGIHHRTRGQIMPHRVSAQLAVRRLPAAIRFRVRGQTGVDAKVPQPAVGVEAQQVLLIPQHRVPERAVQQPHLRQRKRLRLRSDDRHDVAA